MTEEYPFISVIVPVYNGAGLLDNCLSALVAQDYPADRFEIVVVNDGSTDNTVEVAARYPVKLVDLAQNQGRVGARNAGAEAASYELLVFNDARIIPDRDLLADISKQENFPLMPDVQVYDGKKWGYSRFYHLLRSRVYGAYYPLSNYGREFQITADNFDKAPKGMGIFACQRDLWLASQPKTADKMTNDDTRIFSNIVRRTPIYRTTDICVQYRERTEFWPVMRHTFERGPRFADYYLVKGGRFYLPYLLIWFLISILFVFSFIFPPLILFAGIVLVGFMVGVSIFLSRTLIDIFLVLTHFPPIIFAFGLGILKRQIRQFVS